MNKKRKLTVYILTLLFTVAFATAAIGAPTPPETEDTKTTAYAVDTEAGTQFTAKALLQDLNDNPLAGYEIEFRFYEPDGTQIGSMKSDVTEDGTGELNKGEAAVTFTAPDTAATDYYFNAYFPASGEETVIFSSQDDADVNVRGVDSISVSTQPDKLAYNSGQNLDLTGMVITENWSDGATETTEFGTTKWDNNYTANPADGTELVGTDDGTTVTITHDTSGETAETDPLTVEVVESIEVTTQPDSLEYYAGESLQLAGMVVTETYTDGSTETTTFDDADWNADYTADPADGTELVEGDDGSAVTVTYEPQGVTADTNTLTVNVLDSISVSTQPDKLEYDSGESLDLTGMVITETLADGTTNTVDWDSTKWNDNYSASPASGTELAEADDGTAVTVTHTSSGLTADTNALTVNTVVESISVDTQPDTTTYYSGETLDLTGLAILAYLKDVPSGSPIKGRSGAKFIEPISRSKRKEKSCVLIHTPRRDWRWFS